MHCSEIYEVAFSCSELVGMRLIDFWEKVIAGRRSWVQAPNGGAIRTRVAGSHALPMQHRGRRGPLSAVRMVSVF